MWKCKECGGKIRLAVPYVAEKCYNINKNGFSVGKCLMKIDCDRLEDYYYCARCNKKYKIKRNELEKNFDWEDEE